MCMRLVKPFSYRSSGCVWTSHHSCGYGCSRIAAAVNVELVVMAMAKAVAVNVYVEPVSKTAVHLT